MASPQILWPQKWEWAGLTLLHVLPLTISRWTVFAMWGKRCPRATLKGHTPRPVPSLLLLPQHASFQAPGLWAVSFSFPLVFFSSSSFLCPRALYIIQVQKWNALGEREAISMHKLFTRIWGGQSWLSDHRFEAGKSTWVRLFLSLSPLRQLRQQVRHVLQPQTCHLLYTKVT